MEQAGIVRLPAKKIQQKKAKKPRNRSAPSLYFTSESPLERRQS